MRSIVKAGRVLEIPGAASVSGSAAIALHDGRIGDVEAIDAETLTSAERGLLAMPALANAHDHGRGIRTAAAGAGDDRLEEWAASLMRHPKVDPYLVAAVSLARMAESGVAAVNHCHNPQDSGLLYAEAEAVSRAARDVGVRVAFALPFADRNPFVYGDLGRLIERLPQEDRPAIAAARQRSRAINEALFERIATLEHSFFQLQYGPVAPQWTQSDTLKAIAIASAADGRRVHMHLLETERQRQWADAVYPQGIVRYLDEIGLLTPRLTLAHAVWLRPDEWALLGERGVTVSVNASSNLRLRSGLPQTAMIRAEDVAFGVGMDGLSIDDDEDMLRELRLLRLLDGVTGEKPMAPAEVLHACCVTGRSTIVGDDGGGRIAAGASADMLLLDFAAMSRDYVRDDFDVTSIVVARAIRRHVRDLYVAGRRIVREGRCCSVDLPALENSLAAEARRAVAAGDIPGDRIARLQAGISSFFADGCHCLGEEWTGSVQNATEPSA